jgi:fumarate reductase (CoM/CoB) subunit B
MNQTIELKIWRFDPQKEANGHWQDFEIPYKIGMRALDALWFIYENIDSTLAFRFGCRAGQCGSCAIMINGKPELACKIELLPEKEYKLEPLPTFAITKDLAVDFSEPFEKMKEIQSDFVKAPEGVQNFTMDEIKDLLEYHKCIECYNCIAACPSVAEGWNEFIGPTYIRKYAQVQLDPRNTKDVFEKALSEGLFRCTTCKACVEACPKDIDLAHKAIEKLRSVVVKHGLGPLEGQKEFIERIRSYGKAVTIEKQPLIGKNGQFGEYVGEGEPVIFFTGCMMDLRLQKIGKDLIDVLNKLGYQVVIPQDQVCCGSPAIRSGDFDLGIRQFKKNVEILERYGIKNVIVGCPGCGITLKDDYARWAKEILKRPLKFSTYDFNEFIHQKVMKSPIETSLDLKVTYHDPCHLGRGQGIKQEPRDLIKQTGSEIVEMKEADRCCGAGGGVRAGIRDFSRLIASRKTQWIKETQAEAVVTPCPFCIFQLKELVKNTGIDMDIVHTATLLNRLLKHPAK